MHDNFEILIAGGGIAGMTAAIAFADAGFSTLCVDRAPAPNANKGAETAQDLRSTAFLAPSVALLEQIGLFQHLRPHAAALRVMRIADAGGDENEIRQSVDFVAEEIGAAEFGWNIPNTRIRDVLIDRIAAHPNADLRHGLSVTRLTPRLAETIATLSDGPQIRARVVVAADGRDSQLRSNAGIAAQRTHYGQKANVFSVSHDRAHDGISTEIHRSGGPFTIVPLAGADQSRSAIVWMESGPEAARLHELPDAAFLRAANLRSCGVMGTLRDISDRAIWPIVSQRAECLYGDRLALIGEAAHVVPPIGAQGLNMSLGDIATLRDLFQGADDIGAPQVLEAYHRRRDTDIRLRVRGIDALNRASMADAAFLRDLRGMGLRVIAETALKRPLMALGMGRQH